MSTYKTLHLSKLSPSFHFPGFVWPRYYATLPRGPIAKRKERRKNVICGSYYGSPLPVTKGSARFSFYLESDFMPGLRWKWADEVDGARIRHTGWFSDSSCTDKIRGLVFRLPHGRGFLAGWAMGEEMCGAGECYAYESEVDAARAADSIVESVADAARAESEETGMEID